MRYFVSFQWEWSLTGCVNWVEGEIKGKLEFGFKKIRIGTQLGGLGFVNFLEV